MPENGVRNCVNFCLWPSVSLDRCAVDYWYDIIQKALATLVFLITDQVPNNHPVHQISGSSRAMALLTI